MPRDVSRLMREAADAHTAHERLCQLATDAHPVVRAQALDNPSLPRARRDLLLRAAQPGAPLTTQELDWLASQGPYGQRVAVRHPSTGDVTLLKLVRLGHARQVAQQKHISAERWRRLAEQADGAALERLSRTFGLPGAARKAVRARLGNRQHPGAATSPGVSAARDLSTEATHAVPAAVQGAAPEPAALRARLRARTPDLTPAEFDAVKSAGRDVQRLALKHPQTPWPLLEWLAEHGHEESARTAMLVRARAPGLDPALQDALAHHADWEYREAVAGSPDLPERLLRVLAGDEDWWVRATIAEHPSCPPDVLGQLASEPYHVVIREAVAANPHAPSDALRALARDSEVSVRLAAARNPSTPDDALGELALEASARIREAVAAHPLASSDLLHALERDPDERVRTVAQLRRSSTPLPALQAAVSTKRGALKLAVAVHPNADEQLLERATKDRNPNVRALAGLHPRVPHDALDRLRADHDRRVRRVALAAHPRSTPRDLSELPRHDARVRLALAQNNRAPATVLASLSADESPPVREAVALNPTTPEEGLLQLVPDRLVRAHLRRHQRYNGPVRQHLHDQELREAKGAESAELLAELAMSEFSDVRVAVAHNQHTPESVLQQLTGDDSFDVRAALLRRSSLPLAVQRALARDADMRNRQGLLFHAACAPEVFVLLAADPLVEIRRMLASRPGTPASALEVLAANAHEELRVLELVSAHANATEAVLRHLAQHPQVSVRRLVARHDHVTPALLEILARDADVGVASLVLDHPGTPPDALHALIRHHPQLRYRVAQHPNTAAGTLEDLAHDWLYELVTFLTRRDHFGADDRFVLGRLVHRRAARQRTLLLAIARHPNASAKAVRRAARGQDPQVLCALHERPLTPTEK